MYLQVRRTTMTLEYCLTPTGVISQENIQWYAANNGARAQDLCPLTKWEANENTTKYVRGFTNTLAWLHEYFGVASYM